MNARTDFPSRPLAIAACLSLALSIAGHLLPPVAYPAASLLWDYEFGLIRRGLVGTLLNPFFGETATLGELHLATAAVTLVGAFSLAAFGALRLWGERGAALLLILLLNSFAFRSFVGATGYLDGILVALTVAALLSPAATGAGLALRVGVCVVAMFVHESMLPYFGVLIALDLWLARLDRPVRQRLMAAAAPLLAALAALVVIEMGTARALSDVAAFQAHLNGKHGLGVDLPHLPILEGGIAGQLAVMAEMRAGDDHVQWLAFDGLPLWLMSLWLIWLNLRVLPVEAGALTRLGILGAILAPLSLNLIAFDVVRFGSVSVIVGFLVLALQRQYLPQAAERIAAVMTWPHFLILLILNLHVTTMQINGVYGHEDDLPWLFFEHLKWAF
ncbi:hypothetical protein HMH01_04825 [Halovulum dunhuangense]|uniref:Uncharacterized protein n=1 Tax=Halovulum dunhuangense TaxID=1505036 RepID=A0A849L0H6_9RHOB|nr:hypothetical protein [Halovulum dunhuangense]NNU79761.1 hypothetical protein [Halovulum dunhuangense]